MKTKAYLRSKGLFIPLNKPNFLVACHISLVYTVSAYDSILKNTLTEAEM